jgi:hypothetical protein
MRLEMPPQQRKVVLAAVGPHLGAALAQGLETACRRQILAYLCTQRSVVPVIVNDIYNPVEQVHEAFHLFTLPRLDERELFLGPLVDSTYPANEHLGEIAGTHTHLMQQRYDQGIATLGQHLLQIGRVQTHRLR